MYFCIKKNKKYQGGGNLRAGCTSIEWERIQLKSLQDGWGWAPLLNALAPFTQVIGQRGPLWKQIYLAYN